MGSGLEVFCDHCGFSSAILEGVGFLYPSLIEELRDRALNGEFGDKLKAVIEANPEGMINGEKSLYVCRKCGNWQVEPKLSYYIPAVVETTFFEEPDRTSRLYTHRHRCKKCNSVMHMHSIKPGDDPDLKCPDCGKQLRVSDMHILWD